MENQNTYEVTVKSEAIPQSEALEKIIQESHLELSEGEQIKQSYLPYFNQLAKVKEDAKKINFENPSPIDSQIAKQLRLDAMRIRTGSEKVKEERKRIHLLKSNLEQSAWNLIRDTCKLEEAGFEQVEKFAENQEKLRIANLAAERTEKLIPYHSFERDTVEPSAAINLMYPNLGLLSDDQFEMMLNGAILAHEKRIADAKKAEEERIVYALTTESTDFQLIHQLEESRQFQLAEQERIRIENEKLKEQQAVIEKQLAEERARAEADLALRKEQEELAAKRIIEAQNKANEELAEQQRIADAKLKSEREKSEALQAELEAKKNAEIKKKKAEAAAAKKAAAAPDRDKIVRYSFEINALINAAPEIKSEPYVKLMEDVKGLLYKVNKYIDDKLTAEETSISGSST